MSDTPKKMVYDEKYSEIRCGDGDIFARQVWCTEEGQELCHRYNTQPALVEALEKIIGATTTDAMYNAIQDAKPALLAAKGESK